MIQAGVVNESMLVIATADFSMLRENRERGTVARFTTADPPYTGKKTNGFEKMEGIS